MTLPLALWGVFAWVAPSPAPPPWRALRAARPKTPTRAERRYVGKNVGAGGVLHVLERVPTAGRRSRWRCRCNACHRVVICAGDTLRRRTTCGRQCVRHGLAAGYKGR